MGLGEFSADTLSANRVNGASNLLPRDIAMRVPDNWLSMKWYQRPLSMKGSEFCRIHNQSSEAERYIRCVLALPLKGTDEEFRFGVWMSVSKESWNIYRRGYRSEQYEKHSCFGMLGNHLPNFGATFGMHADIEFQAEGQRPLVFLHEADHPLFYAQRDGLEIANVQRLMAK
ncbi:MAG: DUF2199 domain-containing protein [Rhizobiaceae bacterium]|nr:DUF2199 domain-containing protein [Rhizobiaceae bacterium]